MSYAQRRCGYRRRAAGAFDGDRLAGRARPGAGDAFRVTSSDALGRMTLARSGSREALVTRISGRRRRAGSDCVLVDPEGHIRARRAAHAAGVLPNRPMLALEQAHLFAQLGQKNEEIARQKDELADRSDVIRDIVYALGARSSHAADGRRRFDETSARRRLRRASRALSDRFLRSRSGGQRRRAADRRNAAAGRALRSRRSVDAARADRSRPRWPCRSSKSCSRSAEVKGVAMPPTFRRRTLRMLRRPERNPARRSAT